MFNAITRSAAYVLDQDEAPDFYVGMHGSGEHPAPAPDCAR